ncbi:hypothetical protein HID58_081028, partial [Brassica napus]
GKHIEMIPGDWKGCNESEINNCPETLSLIERCQTDFSAPSLESLRHYVLQVVMYVFNQSKKEEEYRNESRILGRLQYSIRAAPLSLDSVLDRKMPA